MRSSPLYACEKAGMTAAGYSTFLQYSYLLMLHNSKFLLSKHTNTNGGCSMVRFYLGRVAARPVGGSAEKQRFLGSSPLLQTKVKRCARTLSGHCWGAHEHGTPPPNTQTAPCDGLVCRPSLHAAGTPQEIELCSL